VSKKGRPLSCDVPLLGKKYFSQGNSYGALPWAIVTGNVVASVMALCQKKVNDTGDMVKLITGTELFESFFEGVGVLD